MTAKRFLSQQLYPRIRFSVFIFHGTQAVASVVDLVRQLQDYHTERSLLFTTHWR